MNSHDRANLEFLRQLTDDALQNWFSQASEDDVEYAQELLEAWERELNNEVFGMEFAVQSVTMH
jgi:hypothetical protein